MSSVMCSPSGVLYQCVCACGCTYVPVGVHPVKILCFTICTCLYFPGVWIISVLQVYVCSPGVSVCTSFYKCVCVCSPSVWMCFLCYTKCMCVDISSVFSGCVCVCVQQMCVYIPHHVLHICVCQVCKYASCVVFYKCVRVDMSSVFYRCICFCSTSVYVDVPCILQVCICICVSPGVWICLLCSTNVYMSVFPRCVDMPPVFYKCVYVCVPQVCGYASCVLQMCICLCFPGVWICPLCSTNVYMSVFPRCVDMPPVFYKCVYVCVSQVCGYASCVLQMCICLCSPGVWICLLCSTNVYMSVFPRCMDMPPVFYKCVYVCVPQVCGYASCVLQMCICLCSPGVWICPLCSTNVYMSVFPRCVDMPPV